MQASPEILNAIPHRPPFLFVDTIVERKEDGIVCRKTFEPDEYFFAGHYPDVPLVPGVILCEAAMQAAAVFLSEKLKDCNEVSEANEVTLQKMFACRRKRNCAPDGRFVTAFHFSIISTHLKEQP